MTSIKTRKEVEQLKIGWEEDPVWDIECTEGFEAYYSELLAYRKQKELEWKIKQENEYKNNLSSFLSYNNLVLQSIVDIPSLNKKGLVEYLYKLHLHIDRLEDEINELKDRVRSIERQ